VNAARRRLSQLQQYNNMYLLLLSSPFVRSPPLRIIIIIITDINIM